MNNIREIKKTKIQDFTHNIWEKEPIIRNYHKISAYINTRNNLSDKYRDFLAAPVFQRSNETVSWVSSSFTTFPPKTLSSLSGDEYNFYKSILHEYLNQYAGIIKQENNRDSVDMLKSALVFSSEDTVFCSDGKVVIAEWGMNPKNTNPIDMMSVYLKGEKNISKSIDNPQTDIEKPEEVTALSDNGSSEKQTEFPENNLQTYDEPLIPKSKPEPKKKDVSEKKEDEFPQLEHSVLSNDAQNNRNDISNTGYSENSENQNHSSKKNFFRKFWWLWLLLLLLALLALLLSKCGGNKALPHTPGIIMKPITGDDIVSSPDSLTKVVANRLNVLIKDGGSVVEFAHAFKETYPQKQYEIVYYDTIVPRVQILFPADEKEIIREELPAKLPQFTIFLWDESLFETRYVPNDPAMNDSKKRWYFELCRAFEAWNITMGDTSIVVAIIDNGFDLNHPELYGKIYKPFNSVTRNSNIFASSNGHGTHVASTAIGIADNNTGTAGIAPKCKFMPIQVTNKTGLMTTTAIIDAVLYAITQGADVANLSLGMSFDESLQYIPIGFQKSMIINNFLEEEKVWNEIFAMAEKNHCTLVLAAGNENVLAGIDPMQRNHLGIKVSAVQPDLRKTDFSNYGDFSTVSAPGIEIYNSIPNNQYAYLQGTSMAAPIVTGAVALLKSKDKNLSTPQIISILDRTGLNSPSHVGRIIQLDKALAVVDGTYDPGTPAIDCTAITERIEQLQRELEQLKKQYPDCYTATIPDTLSFPDGKIDIISLRGRWKSTTPLFSSSGEEVTLYFDFNGTNKGQLLLVDESYTQFQSTTTLSLNSNKLTIIQDAVTSNLHGKPDYPPYHFTCKPDNRQQAECAGVNTTDISNKINFRLIKIN